MKTILMRILLLIILFSPLFTIAQHGNLDVTFNPYDTAAFGNLSGADSKVTIIREQQDGKKVIAGGFTSYHGVSAEKITRINTDGSLDSDWNQEAANFSGLILALEIQNDGKIIVAGTQALYEGQSRNIVRLNADGSLDNTFNTGIAPNDIIRSIKILDNGKILVVGQFTAWNGTGANRIVRLNSNGSIDQTFNVGIGPNSHVFDIDVLSTGEIIAVGYFDEFNFAPHKGYVKLTSNGSLVPGFTTNSFDGICNSWRQVEIQSDDKILLSTSSYLYRIETDGTIDTTFTHAGPSAGIERITLLENEKIAVCGGFGSFNSQPVSKLAILHNNGEVDVNLSINVSGGDNKLHCLEESNTGNYIIGGSFSYITGANTGVTGFSINNMAIVDTVGNVLSESFGIKGIPYTVAVQDDDKILAGGFVNSYNGVPTPGLMRLEPNGDLDYEFHNNFMWVNAAVNDIFVQQDGKILIGGAFTYVNGVEKDKIARLLPNGSLDTTFNGPDFNHGDIKSIDVLPNGQILVAGSFRYVDNQLKHYIARLNSDGSDDPTFSSPLFDNVTFNIEARKVKAVSNSKIMVSGRFSCCAPMLRLNADGTIDNSFDLNSSAYIINDFIELDNGKFVFGGTWSSNPGSSKYIVQGRNSDGSYDDSFNQIDGGTGFSSYSVKSLKRINNEKILVCGSFPNISGLNRDVFVVSNNGTRDQLFDVSENFTGGVTSYDCGIQSNGKIIVVGDFSEIDGVLRNGIARLHYDEMADANTTELNLGKSILLSPNPTSGISILDNSNNQSLELSIYSSEGKLVEQFSSDESSIEINLEKEHSGIYFVTVQSNESTETIKIIKK